MPPYAILVCLLIPFAVAEPLKVVGLVWIGEGRVKVGVLTLVLAYLASFLLVDRIYHAGRDKLLSIAWFAAVMVRLVAIREAVLEPVRRSDLYIAAVAAAKSAKARVRALLRLAPRT